MNELFADTAYFLALFDENDQWHAKAKALSFSLRPRIVVTEFVLVELGNALSSRRGRPAFAKIVAALRRDKDARLIPLSSEWFDAGIELYDKRPDKEWSLVDCISFLVMKQERITEALTNDHHFIQAGFKLLMK